MWHEQEFREGTSFAYVVRDAGGAYLGCCYLYPMGRRTELTEDMLRHDVDVSWWVTTEAYERGVYEKLYEALRVWVADKFPFDEPYFSNSEVRADRVRGVTDEVFDPAYAERLEAVAPDELYRRRDFLERLAGAAGVGMGLAAGLGVQPLIAEAARGQHRALPSARNLPIDTIVVVMMENRSFDHLLGWMPHADGRQGGPDLPEQRRRAVRDLSARPRLPGLRASDPRPRVERGPGAVQQRRRKRLAARRKRQRHLRDRLLRGEGPQGAPEPGEVVHGV